MVNIMEWQKQQPQQQSREVQQSGNVNGNGGGGMMYVKVMTDGQLETLREQIAVYTTICEQLVEMHKTLTAQQDLAGVRLGNIYCDPLMTSAGHKITSRQRWTPTPVQLQILERIFDQGNGTPSKQKIKEITAELSQHGQISETNVYNWFQNRRARSKRKQQNVAPNNTESEVETEVESSKDKKTKPEELQSQLSASARAEELCFQNHEVCSDLHYLNPESSKPESIFPSDGSLKSSRSFGQMSVFDGVLSNSTMDDQDCHYKPINFAGDGYMAGKMQVPGSYNLYQQAGDYNMTG